MVGIASVLAYLYPSAVPLADYVVTHAAGADHITQWNTGTLGAQPDEASLATTQASAPYLTYISAPEVAKRLAQSEQGTIGRVTVKRLASDVSTTSGSFSDLISSLRPLVL